MIESVVEKNKVVSLTYVLHNQSGEIFEYTDLPVTYVHGGNSDLFEKIEQTLEGHKVGDKVEVELSPSEGFGDHDPSLTFTDDLENVPQELRRVGTDFEAQSANGEVLKFVVTAIDTKHGMVTVDSNHPLAGQTVRFQLTIQDIRDATPEEVQTGKTESVFAPMLH